MSYTILLDCNYIKNVLIGMMLLDCNCIRNIMISTIFLYKFGSLYKTKEADSNLIDFVKIPETLYNNINTLTHMYYFGTIPL